MNEDKYMDPGFRDDILEQLALNMKRIEELEKKVDNNLEYCQNIDEQLNGDIIERIEKLEKQCLIVMLDNKRIEKLEKQYQAFIELDHHHTAFDQIDQLEQNDTSLYIFYEQQKERIEKLESQNIGDNLDNMDISLLRINERLDGMSNGCSLAQQNLKELSELKEALAEYHEQYIDDIAELKEQASGSCNVLSAQIDELKEQLDKRGGDKPPTVSKDEHYGKYYNTPPKVSIPEPDFMWPITVEKSDLETYLRLLKQTSYNYADSITNLNEFTDSIYKIEKYLPEDNRFEPCETEGEGDKVKYL